MKQFVQKLGKKLGLVLIQVKGESSFQNLIAQMRVAQHSEGKLIKNNIEGRSFDLIDSLFLALLHYYFSLELS
ncbi:MAG TPA: hypothetical protein VKA95_03795 [Nitrososphaeraceae archaeon]|nr:hypothetical protein [Nitrososphaeraceae archaeon]